MARKCGLLLIVLAAVVATPRLFASPVTGAISGYIKSSTGAPQSSAVVEISASAVKLGVIVVTDARGFYSAKDLPAGTYSVKATFPSFLPSLQDNLTLRSGAHLVVNLTLSTLSDAMKLIPQRRPVQADPDDWHWTLKSSAGRPVLRIYDDGPMVVVSKGDSRSDSRAEEADDRVLKARVAFIAGSQADGFGSTGEMTTAFSLEKSLFSSGLLSFNGNVDTSTGDPNGVLRASYSGDFGSSRPTVTITYRHLASPGAALQNAAYSAVALTTSDRMEVSDFLELNYGSDLEAVDFGRHVMAFRPFGSADFHLSPNMVLEYRFDTSQPDLRREKGFDTAPADLSESGPRMALAGGIPQVERARHQELSLSRRFGRNNVQVAYYLDQIANMVLTGAGDPSAYSDNVLSDVYSGTFSYGAGSLSTTGARLVLQRRFTDDLTGTLDFSTGGVATLRDPLGTWQGVASDLTTARRHSIATRFAGYIPSTGTRWIASYKWTNGSALSSVDEFNASAGQADPNLSFFLRQPLPARGFIQGRMEALVDVRNLLAQGYVPVMGQDGRTIFLVQSARSVRGGVSFTF